VLGACLTGGTEVITTVRDVLTVGDEFYNPRHTVIWEVIVALHRNGEPADPVTVADHCRQRKIAVDPVYLSELYSAAPVVMQAGHHATILRRLAAARRVITTGMRITQAGQAADPDRIADVLTWARAQLEDTIETAAVLDTWRPVDVTPVLEGGTMITPPSLGIREDGKALMYAGRVHTISGEPESGKSWFAITVAAQEIQHYHVVYLDFEDTADGVVGRLLAVGAESIAERFHYVRPDRPLDVAGKAALTDLLNEHYVSLVVIDGVTEAMALHGLDPEVNLDAAKFYELLPRFLTRHHPAPSVLMIDHVPKSKDRDKRYAFGAQHKLAGMDGVAYMCDIKQHFAPGVAGYSVLRIAKDRQGGVRQHAPRGIAAEMHIDGNTERTAVVVRLEAVSKPRHHPEESPGSFRPTGLMERVSRYVELGPGSTGRSIEQAVRGKNDYIRLALERLVIEGYMEETQVRSRGGGYAYRSIQPFRETNDEEDEDE
jgi:hypothetical protein